MNKFFTLLKVDLINGFSLNLNFSKNKKNKAKRSNSKVGMLLFVILMLGVSFMYAFMIGSLARSANNTKVLLAYGISVGTLTTLMLTFTNAYGTLFKSKDFELLASLPIDNKIIVASKITSLSIIGFAYFAVMYIPAIIVYIAYSNINALFVLISLLVLVLMPLLITAICSFIAYLIGLTVSRFKNKNIISTIIYTVFLLAIIVGIYTFSFTMPDEGASEEVMLAYTNRMFNMFSNINPLTPIFIEAMLGNIVNILILLGVTIVPFVIFILIVGHRYTYINQRSLMGYKSANFKMENMDKYSKHSLTKTLMNKEFKTIFSTPVYLTNVIIGPIMSMAMIIVLSYLFTYKIGSLSGDEDVQMLYPFKVTLICAMFLFLGGISPATAASISMEGKKFWIVKSLPIEEKKYLNVKVLVSYLLMAPFNLIGSIVASIICKANVIDTLCLILVPQVGALFYSLIGLLLNLKFYNLEWDNPTQAVKQGANIFLPMLIDFGLFGILVSTIVISLTFNISVTWGILIIVSILLLIFYLVYKKHRISLFNKIAG